MLRGAVGERKARRSARSVRRAGGSRTAAGAGSVHRRPDRYDRRGAATRPDDRSVIGAVISASSELGSAARRCRSWSSRTSPGSSPSSGVGSRLRGSWSTPRPTAPTGLRRAREQQYDLVVLDLLLPGLDGLAVLRELAPTAPELPVVILSARSDLRTKLRGFELGARDYVPKPFSLDELVARVRAQLRAVAHGATPTNACFAPARSSSTSRAAARGSASASPTSPTASSGCCSTSSDTPARSCSREQLLAAVWGYHFDPGSNVVDVCIRRLRKKLGSTPIETVRHVGYRIAAA